ncbi:MAG: hypothetical protein ACLUKN_08310 [Bacilli bacterium]
MNELEEHFVAVWIQYNDIARTWFITTIFWLICDPFNKVCQFLYRKKNIRRASSCKHRHRRAHIWEKDYERSRSNKKPVKKISRGRLSRRCNAELRNTEALFHAQLKFYANSRRIMVSGTASIEPGGKPHLGI